MKAPFFVRYGLMIAAITVFFWPIVGVGALRGLKSNRNDVQDWLPSNYPETTSFKWFLSHFAGDEFIVVSWDGCTLSNDRLIRFFIDKVIPSEPDPKKPEHYYFKAASTGKDLIEKLTKEPINLEPEQAIERLKGTMIGRDGETTCVIFTLTDSGKFKVKNAVKRLREVANLECNISPENLRLGGTAVDNAAIDEAGEKSLLRLASVAGLVGVAISWWCLRSGRLIAMVFFTGIYCAALSLAIVYFSGTPLNAILLTMPSLVYVAAISAAIHLSNYYRDTAVEEGLIGAPTRALKHAALPLFLATTTTAIGLVSLITSDLVPIKLFGLYSAIGVIASLVPLCFFLPSAFQLWPLKSTAIQGEEQTVSKGPEFSPVWWHIGRGIIKHHALVTFASVVVLCIFGYGITKVSTSTQLMRMFPDDARIKKDYIWLEKNLGDLVPMEVVLKFDSDVNKTSFLDRMRVVDVLEQHIKSVGRVGSTMSAATFLGPKLFQDETHRKQFNLEAALDGVREKPSLVNRRAMYSNVMTRKLDNNKETFRELDFVDDETVVEADDTKKTFELWRVSARVSALDDVNFAVFQEDLRQVVDTVLGNDENKLAHGLSVVYTGLVPLVDKSQRSLLDGLFVGFITDLVVVTIVMIVAIREWAAGIVLLLPSVFPVVLVFGYMGWAGVVVDTGTVMAPGVALGVTIDDVVHFMLKYRNGLEQGLDRKQSIMLAYKGCARPMYQSWGVIGLGLSAFALSPFTPTQRFGYLMVTLLTAAMIGNLVVLPAILAGPFGKLFGRKFQLQPRKSGTTDDEANLEHPPAQPHLRAHWHEESLAK